ncbi:MAG: hypothetical protein VYB54_14830 [Pseudomonadota bacterium]|nr:hypothetical protein [Pseudomonadota bacterium]
MKNSTEIIDIDIAGNDWLSSFDPSSFQQVIIGILAIFIPFSIVYLSAVTSSSRDEQALHRMILNYKVFYSKSIFSISIFSLSFFSFFSHTNTSVWGKILSILVLIITVLVFWKFFLRIVKYSEGNEEDFEKQFLNSINVLRFWNIDFSNDYKKMEVSWRSIWVRDKISDERHYLQIFIRHIDQLFEGGYTKKAVQLCDIYYENLPNRDKYWHIHEFFPNTFRWDAIVNAVYNKQMDSINNKEDETLIIMKDPAAHKRLLDAYRSSRPGFWL